MDIIINEASGICAIGALSMELPCAAEDCGVLDKPRAALEQALREQYAGATRAELKAVPPINTYVQYYKRFGYSYHVLGQLESILKGKHIPSVQPLVEAMFMAELKNALLTAGHDQDKLSLPLRAQVCTGTEQFLAMGERETVMVENDVMLSDSIAPVSSILRGPDARTAIAKDTTRVLYIAYAPADIAQAQVMAHLNDIEQYVKTVSPGAVTSVKQVYA